MGRPTRLHEDRKDALDTLATLCGFTQNLAGGLPDGSRPDVLRVSIARRAIFIGEAKATESAHSTEVAARLTNYMNWLCAAPAGSVIALGVGWEHTLNWAATVDRLAKKRNLRLSPVTEIDLEDLVCLWWTKT